jgi:hypothetical protein
MDRVKAAGRTAVCILVFCTGCASEAGRWREAESANTTSAYEQFLRQYPDGTHASEAGTRLKCLRDFEDLKENESVSAYEDFLREYPDSALSTQARSRLDALKAQEAKEMAAWETACKENSFKGYLQYHLDYGNARAHELRERLLSLIAQVDERGHAPANLSAHMPYLLSGANAMSCCNVSILFTNQSRMTLRGGMFWPYSDGEYRTTESLASICFGPRSVRVAYLFLPSAEAPFVFMADREGLHHVGGQGFVIVIEKDVKVYEY